MQPLSFASLTRVLGGAGYFLGASGSAGSALSIQLVYVSIVGCYLLVGVSGLWDALPC